jgi:hypothetical protein
VKIYAENGGGPRRAAEKALLSGGLAALPIPYPASHAILQAKRIEFQQQPDLGGTGCLPLSVQTEGTSHKPTRATQAQLLVRNYDQATDPLVGVMMRKHECFSAALSGSPLFSA